MNETDDAPDVFPYDILRYFFLAADLQLIVLIDACQ